MAQLLQATAVVEIGGLCGQQETRRRGRVSGCRV